uniref:Uncharacterized protein n=1 Tax=Anguilla anguilla TaxID=7936 RepID=A0A0E9Q1S6_ANGAN
MSRAIPEPTASFASPVN